jgi:hypothetical protein
MQLHTTPHNYLFSLRSGFTAYFVISPVTGFVATVAHSSSCSCELDASIGAPGPHDFAVRDKRGSSSTRCVHRIPPRVGDVRNAPRNG